MAMHEGAAAQAFEILLAWSETTLTVRPGETALQVLLAAGVPVATGCEVGNCGDCAFPYIEGDIIHKDHCLTPADRQRYFCPCVSRARSRIVLAL
jgi:vanillate O-demethylase ferredoxin subunit